jgi:iron complex outermembrane recepter protein
MLVTVSYSYDHTAVLTGCSGTVNSSGVFIANANAFCVSDAAGDPLAIEPGSQPIAGAGGLQTVKGDPLPNAPENKFAIDLAYTWHFTPGSLTLSGDYYYRGQQNGSLFNTVFDRAPSWDGVDLRGLWKGPNDKYEIIAYVKNVFNSLQYTTGAAAAYLQGNATSIAGNEVQSFELNPPRTFGVEMRYKFF